jgi:DNA-binding response OmpR family regulator
MKKTLLVVDDSSDITFALKKLFEEELGEYKVLIADTGEKCLEILKNNSIPDAIILDIMLPGIDGWETYERIKKNDKWSNIPIVFLTARSDYFTMGAGRFLGEGYVEKPFEPHELIRRVEKAITKYHS